MIRNDRNARIKQRLFYFTSLRPACDKGIILITLNFGWWQHFSRRQPKSNTNDHVAFIKRVYLMIFSFLFFFAINPSHPSQSNTINDRLFIAHKYLSVSVVMIYAHLPAAIGYLIGYLIFLVTFTLGPFRFPPRNTPGRVWPSCASEHRRTIQLFHISWCFDLINHCFISIAWEDEKQKICVALWSIRVGAFYCQMIFIR